MIREMVRVVVVVKPFTVDADEVEIGRADQVREFSRTFQKGIDTPKWIADPATALAMAAEAWLRYGCQESRKPR